MKFKAHETFFIRKGWLSKGMKHIVKKPDLFIDKNENPMDILGLGSNMVKSLRYWLLATGLCEEIIENKKHIQHLTDFGKLVFENDKFLEETGTLQLLHYKLASNKENATAWFCFFNRFPLREFMREDFISDVKKFLLEEKQSENEKPNAESSISADFDCIANTYLPRYKLRSSEVDPENNIDCPLGELGLLDVVNKRNGVFKKSIPLVSSFAPQTILAVIADNSFEKTEIHLNDLLTKENNIGKIFNFDTCALLEILRSIEKIGYLKIIRTSGLDVIQLKKNFSFLECVKKYYEDLKK